MTNLDKLAAELNGPRETVRRKMVAMFDLFEVDGLERSFIVGQLEKRLRSVPDSKLTRALEILRE